jgi:epoxyqueuosine reductase QueG
MAIYEPLSAADLGATLAASGVDRWGVAGDAASLPSAPSLPTAISFLMRVRPSSIEGLLDGPTVTYFAEYVRINIALIETGEALVRLLESRGLRAVRVDDDAPDAPGDPPVFPSKTAATRAGLGWIGKTALLVTPEFGPAVRLGTVFTDLQLPGGRAIVDGRCGRCRACVDACPAGAGRDVSWQAGMPRDALYDREACDRQQKQFPQYDEICGICIWACPYARRTLRREHAIGDDAARTEKGAGV